MIEKGREIMPDKATIEALAAMIYKCCQEVAKEEIEKHAEEESAKHGIKELMSVEDFCAYSGKSRQTVYRAKAAGTLPIVPLSDGTYMINVKKWMADSEQNGRKNNGKGLRVIN